VTATGTNSQIAQLTRERYPCLGVRRRRNAHAVSKANQRNREPPPFVLLP
jgi:hypothetical protein